MHLWRGAELAALMLYCGAAYSQPVNPRLTELLRHGVQLRQQGQNEAALREFQAASQISREPRVTAQIALAEQALQRWLDADRHLRSALLAEHDEYIGRHRAVLEAALAEVDRHLGGVLVTGGVSGAEVWVGSERIGTLPMQEPAWIAPGAVTIEVRASGHASTTRDLTVTQGNTTRERVTLEVQGSATQSGQILAVRALLPGDGAPVGAPPTESNRGSAQRTWGWITLVSGVALVGGGVAGLVVQGGKVADFNERGCFVSPGTSVVMGPSDSLGACNADHSSIAGTLGIVGLAGGGALSVLSAVLLATAPSRGASERSQALRFGCGPGPGQLGIACGGAF
jgi:hypothetical protein